MSTIDVNHYHWPFFKCHVTSRGHQPENTEPQREANEHFFGMKELQFGEHGFRQIPKQCSHLDGERKGFYEEKEGGDYLN